MLCRRTDDAGDQRVPAERSSGAGGLADQAGVSRRVGGIHFRSGDHEGRQSGRRIGEQASARAQRYIKGSM
jgi:hypothetical protein